MDCSSLTGIIGHAAIQKPFHDTEFLNEDYLELSNIFSGKSIPDIADMINRLIRKMASRFYGNNMDILNYLCYETNYLAVRIYTANQHEQLRRVFV